MSTPIDWERWDRYKQAIEARYEAGFGPPGSKDGKGSAVEEAERDLVKEGYIQTQARVLCRWFQTQVARSSVGEEHRLPDATKFEVYQARHGKRGFKPVLEGFEISKISSGPSGDFVQQRPSAGPRFTVPEGHTVKGVSAYTRPDGSVIGIWTKTKQGVSQPLTIQAIKEAFDGYTGRAEIVPPPKSCMEDLATVYKIGDHHLGLYAWEEEAGENWDLRKGIDGLDSGISELVSYTPPSGIGVLLGLGDFFHVDTSKNISLNSGHSYDVDTRRVKVCRAGVELLRRQIDRLLSKHSTVIVRILPGNHDEESAPWLSIALDMFYASNPRVTIDCSASRFWFWQFGKNFFAATHGDKAKLESLPGLMASQHPAAWGSTIHRYAFGGHFHKSRIVKDTILGVACETFDILPPVDAWGAGMGFGDAGRSITASTYHIQHGFKLRNESRITNPNRA